MQNLDGSCDILANSISKAHFYRHVNAQLNKLNYCLWCFQCQAVQDVEKAVSLFGGTGKIPATVMEARYSLKSPQHVCGFQPVTD